MSKKPAKPEPAADQALTEAEIAALGALNYEEAVARLERIIDRIEAGEVGLEESLAEYERGVLLVARCRQLKEDALEDERAPEEIYTVAIPGLDLAIEPGAFVALSHQTMRWPLAGITVPAGKRNLPGRSGLSLRLNASSDCGTAEVLRSST